MSLPPSPAHNPRLDAALRLLLWLGAGLGAARALYAGLFPATAWLGGRPGTLAVAGAVALVGFVATRRAPGWALVPLALNLVSVTRPTTEPLHAVGVQLLALWMGAAVWVCLRRPTRAALLPLGLLPIYLLTMARTVGSADTFEFQVTAPQLGIAHPTGYPLYLLLGKLWTLLPVGSPAWRLNLASAVYATVAAVLVLRLLQTLLADMPLTQRLGDGPRALAAWLGAVAFGLAPTLWSQAIVAEVYALHAVFVAGALWLMARLLRGDGEGFGRISLPVALAFWLGLGLTNHLTTLLLGPAALAALLLAPDGGWRPLARRLPRLAAATALPLLLYAYLPLRWQAVNGEPMGAARFVDWVVGGRFQGALQWSAWLRDGTRYGIIGRLFSDEWTPALLGVAAIGLLLLAWQHRRAALLLLLVWLAFTFYALNYYVPDLAVFLIPAQLVVALLVAVLAAGVPFLLQRAVWRADDIALAAALVLLTGFMLQALATWPRVDQSAPNPLVAWATGVLAQPLDDGAAILADSDKFPPLYYLQQAEGVRPDLTITVLPDEAAYRAELDRRLADGQTVYLARYLPRLPYHLRSVGPLVEAATAPLRAVPPDAVPVDAPVGPLRLLGYRLDNPAAVDPGALGLTLYWTAPQPVAEVLHVYTRLADGVPQPGRHPANDSYPTNGWAPGEVVADFHLLPLPVTATTRAVTVQVALAPPFAAAADLAWQTVATTTVAPTIAAAVVPRMAQVGAVSVTGVGAPAQVRPQSPLTVVLAGRGAAGTHAGLEVALVGADAGLEAGDSAESRLAPPIVARGAQEPVVWSVTLATDVPPGDYDVVVRWPGAAARCDWLRPLTAGCAVARVAVSGVPVAADAVNFADRIALLAVAPTQSTLAPGGVLDVTFTWQALADLADDYTVFVQVLDDADRIVGQVDAWPVQGTYPTSRWQPGEIVTDPYRVPLSADLPPGDYRLIAGWYLLRDLRRLPVVDADGAPIDDKITVPGLTVGAP